MVSHSRNSNAKQKVTQIGGGGRAYSGKDRSGDSSGPEKTYVMATSNYIYIEMPVIFLSLISNTYLFTINIKILKNLD